MPELKNRIIIDTNLWISFLLTRDYTKLDRMLAAEAITLLFSQELLDEFLAVARRPKFRKYFSLVDLESLLQQINQYAELITVVSEIDICRDSKDNFLLSLAKDGKGTHLITGDKDLLDIQKFDETVILTIVAYLLDK